MRRTLVACGVAFAVSLISAPAFAAKPVPPPPPACSVVTFDAPTVSCLGFFEGNLIAESGPKLSEALGYTDDLNTQALSLLKKIDLSSNPIDFGTPLYGLTVIGLHFGGGNTGYNGTAFWLLNLPTTVNTVSYTSDVQKGISNAGLYLTGTPDPGVPTQQGAVPEPSTWAMMLIGFGAVGFSLRRRKAQAPRLRVAYA